MTIGIIGARQHRTGHCETARPRRNSGLNQQQSRTELSVFDCVSHWRRNHSRGAQGGREGGRRIPRGALVSSHRCGRRSRAMGQPHRDQRHECSLLWTEICLAYPVLSALGECYEVFIVTDASGGVSVEAHQMTIQSMVQAGAAPLTWIGFASELQRDWAREKTIAGIGEIMSRHGGNIGTSLAWEFQLLGTQPQTKRA